MFNLIVTVALLTGLITGLRCLNLNRDYFTGFNTTDLKKGRLDSWLYVLNVMSTATCLVDVILQFRWWAKGGCPYCDPDWLCYWLAFHFGFAVHAIILHETTNLLLRKSEFRDLFKRSGFGYRPE